MSIKILQVELSSDLKKFLKLPWSIYKGNKCWVPPMINELKNTIDPDKNPSMKKIKHALFLAEMDGKPVARIFAGIDTNLNEKKNMLMGYFSLFECIDDSDVAKSLFKAAFDWYRQNGINNVIGPVSATGTDGDEDKGLLIDCFDLPPAIMNSYNQPYYMKLLEENGFTKDYDVFAYHMDRSLVFKKGQAKIISFAKKKYGFRIDSLNMKDVDGEILSIKHVLDLAVPDEWPDLVAPSLDEVREMAKKLLVYADPELIAIARSDENEAIGFALALPDYNQVLIHLNGRLTPLAALKFFWYKRKINSARVFVMFVIPSFRSKGVSFAIYQNLFNNAYTKGYVGGEASTVGEENQRMRADMDNFGAIRFKTYRIYKKEA
jgi:GNAT superfamily N-acetyltransferase